MTKHRYSMENRNHIDLLEEGPPPLPQGCMVDWNSRPCAWERGMIVRGEADDRWQAARVLFQGGGGALHHSTE
jgi:hypothetical protein